MSKGSAIVGFLLCFLGGMALMWGIDRSGMGDGPTAALTKDGGGSPGAWSDAGAAVPVTSADPMWGKRDAPVTIVVYSDYQCPYCSRAETTLNALKEKYGPDKLRFVWKDFPLPFHKQAMPAHQAGQVVFQLGGNDAFWKFHDLAFQNNKALTPANLEKWAAEAGVDAAKFKEAMAANKGAEKTNADIAAGKKVGVRGTPAFFVNGKFLSGARPQAEFEKEINAELAAAKQLVGAGTPKDQVYTKRAAANFDASKAKPTPDKKKPAQDDKTVWRVGLPNEAAIKGNKSEALVTIVEFSEYQCPYCKKVLPTIKEVMDTYGDKVRVVFLDNPLPFHKRALPASTLAHEAMEQKGMDGYWAAHDMLFENQRKLEDADLESYASDLGLDVDKVKEAIASNKFKDRLASFQELASDLNASGTPHFFINGRRVVGAQPFAKFKEIIDQEIKKAEALVAKGTEKKDLYAAIIKNGKAPPPPEMKEVGAPPDNAPKKGADKPKAVIHEFSDFQCPYCSRVNGTIKQIEKEYGDVVQIVWRHKPLPFHKDAPLAHAAAQEAYAQKGDEGFWAMHDKLFASQKDPGLKRPSLETFAEELGLDLGKFTSALDGNTHEAFVQAENEASTKAGVRGTPAFVIAPANNVGKGYFLSGAQPFGKFKKLIERALKDNAK
ncbi:MAG: thioredoxin domain-containing protein [Myxococcota bacterium]